MKDSFLETRVQQITPDPPCWNDQPCIIVPFLLTPDIDECSTENDCHHNASCKNTKGSYYCTCQDGLEGDGKYCTAGKILFKIIATKSIQMKSSQKGNSSSKCLQFVLASARGVIGATRERNNRCSYCSLSFFQKHIHNIRPKQNTTARIIQIVGNLNLNPNQKVLRITCGNSSIDFWQIVSRAVRSYQQIERLPAKWCQRHNRHEEMIYL